MSDVILTNVISNQTTVAATVHPSQPTPAWTTDDFPETHSSTSQTKGTQYKFHLMSMEAIARIHVWQ